MPEPKLRYYLHSKVASQGGYSLKFTSTSGQLGLEHTLFLEKKE